MRAIAIQLEPGASKSENIEKAAEQIDAACAGASSVPSLVSLPEMWSCLGADRMTKLSQSEILMIEVGRQRLRAVRTILPLKRWRCPLPQCRKCRLQTSHPAALPLNETEFA